MAKTFADYFYKVDHILSMDSNEDRLNADTIQQLDKLFEKVGARNKVNLNDYIFCRLAYDRMAWKMANGKQPYPYGDLVEKWCFYRDLKRVG